MKRMRVFGWFDVVLLLAALAVIPFPAVQLRLFHVAVQPQVFGVSGFAELKNYIEDPWSIGYVAYPTEEYLWDRYVMNEGRDGAVSGFHVESEGVLASDPWTDGQFRYMPVYIYDDAIVVNGIQYGLYDDPEYGEVFTLNGTPVYGLSFGGAAEWFTGVARHMGFTQVLMEVFVADDTGEVLDISPMQCPIEEEHKISYCGLALDGSGYVYWLKHPEFDYPDLP